jgi:hypothetical protein
MLALAILALLATLAPSAASAQGQGRGKKYVGTREIVVDRQTGQLRRPTAEETQKLVDDLSTLVNQSAENLNTVPANGAVALDLDGRFGSVALARPNPDGTTEVRCVTTFEEAAEFLGLVEDVSAQ